MSGLGLTSGELGLLRAVLCKVPEVQEAILFGSRAKGCHRPESDVDLALVGVVDSLTAAAVAEALDLLPMPYRFDVVAYHAIQSFPLREHVKRVGVSIYRRERDGAAAGVTPDGGANEDDCVGSDARLRR